MNRIVSCLAMALFLGGCTTNETKTLTSKNNRAPFGTAVKMSDHICFSSQNPSLQPKNSVTLVTPSEPQSIAQAEVIQSSSTPCPGVRNENPAPFNYDLHLLNGKVESNMPLIAVLAGSRQFKLLASQVQAVLEGYTKPVLFRSCTSADGVHLTAWQGTPLEGERVWHEYYYLGQDLEPTCTNKDTAPLIVQK